MNSVPARTTWTLDAIEEGIAAVESEGMLLHLPLALLPTGVREGDVLAVDREEQGCACTLHIRIDRAATEAALQRSRDQLRSIRPANDPGGDIVL